MSFENFVTNQEELICEFKYTKIAKFNKYRKSRFKMKKCIRINNKPYLKDGSMLREYKLKIAFHFVCSVFNGFFLIPIFLNFHSVF